MKKSNRLNQERIYLSFKQNFQLKDLMAEFGISKRTALRDIAELEAMGLAIYAEAGRNGGYRLLKQDLIGAHYLNTEELTAIFFALKALNELTASPFEKSYPQLYQKLLVNLSSSQQQAIDNTLSVIAYHNVAPIGTPRFLDEILAAILHEQVLEIAYQQQQSESLQVQLYDVFYRRGYWFCNAYQVQTKTWRIIRCDYISGLQTAAEQTASRPRHELQADLQAFERDFLNIPFRCRLTPFGREIFLRGSYRDMRLEDVDGVAYLLGNFNQSELHYMVHYLMEFGKHIKIESPELLKNAYLAEMEAVVQSYQNAV
ncbi:MAG: WYL domain-containing protein [Neisseria sp.]|nr:WYL domain-containing protein [Neisseria sp.]